MLDVRMDATGFNAARPIIKTHQEYNRKGGVELLFWDEMIHLVVVVAVGAFLIILSLLKATFRFNFWAPLQ